MTEDEPVSLQEQETSQQKELLEGLGILVNEEGVRSTYDSMLKISNDHEAANRATYTYNTSIEGRRLAEAVANGQVTAADMYDSTGALTLAGKLAKHYLDDEVKEPYHSTSTEDTDPNSPFGILLSALNSSRVEDVATAQVGAAAENYSRESQSAAQFIADHTANWDTNGYVKGTEPTDIQGWMGDDFGQSGHLKTTEAIRHDKHRAIEEEKNTQKEAEAKYNEEPYIGQGVPEDVQTKHAANLHNVTERANTLQERRQAVHNDVMDRAQEDAEDRASSGLDGMAKTAFAKVTGGLTPAEATEATTRDVNVAALNMAHEAGQSAKEEGEMAMAEHQEEQEAQAPVYSPNDDPY